MNGDELLELLELNLAHFSMNDSFKDSEEKTREILSKILSLISDLEFDKSNKIRKKILGFITKYEKGIIHLFLSSLLVSIHRFNSISEYPYIDSTYFTEEKDTQLFNKVFNNYTNKVKISLRESNHEFIDINCNESIKVFSLISSMLQSKALGSASNEDESIMTITFLSIANICNRQGKIDRWEFYLLCDVAMRNLNRNSLHQKVRDFSEEIYLMSVDEFKPIYGYYIQLKSYIFQRNIIDSSLYLLLFINRLDKNIPINVIINVLKSIQIFFRDNMFFEPQKEIFNMINEIYKDHLIDTDIMQINYCNFISDFNQNIDISNDLVTFLNKYKEMIFTNGSQSIKIWLSLIIQIYDIYNNDILYLYKTNFYNLLPPDDKDDLEQLLGNGDINYYNRIISRLSESRTHRDMVSEIKNYTNLFRNFVIQGFKDKEYKKFINGFIMISDRSLQNIENLDYPKFTEIHFNKDKTHDYYTENIESFKKIDFKNTELILITHIQNNVIYMNSSQKQIRFSELESKWKLSYMNQHLKNICSDMRFTTYSKNYEFEDHDYIDQLREQSLKFTNYQLKTISTKPLEVIYDTDTSRFPSNLIQENNNFVFLDRPIFTSLNYNSILNRKDITINIKKIKLWSPIDTADLALNKLYSSLSHFLDVYEIDSYTGIQIEENLTSDISIVIAHGGNNIDDSNTLHARDNYKKIDYQYSYIEKNVKKSKILLLFVCHSGKISKDIFYEKTNSIIRKFTKNDVEAIIAPKWPLSIEIIPIWLPVFIDSLNSGYSSLESFHLASKSVYNKFKNAGTWACLHYFGNPNIHT